METSPNGPGNRSMKKRQHGHKVTVVTETNQGAIMESLDPSLVRKDIENGIESAATLPSFPKHDSCHGSVNQTEKNNMSSSTSSFMSVGTFYINLMS